MTVKTANRESTGKGQSIPLFLPMPQPNLPTSCGRLSESIRSITSCCWGKEPLPPPPTPRFRRRGRTERNVERTWERGANRAYRTNVMSFPTALVGFLLLLVSGTSFLKGALIILRATYFSFQSTRCNQSRRSSWNDHSYWCTNGVWPGEG